MPLVDALDRLCASLSSLGAELAIAALGTAACGGERKPADTPAADTAAPEPAGPTARLIKTVEDSLQAPEAARWDPDQKIWFVANINGAPSTKDNNGFISRIASTGSRACNSTKLASQPGSSP